MGASEATGEIEATAAVGKSDAREASLELFVNGERRAVAPGATLASLLEALGLGQRRCAVAVNRSVVPRSHHARVALSAGDRIEILEAVGGG